MKEIPGIIDIINKKWHNSTMQEKYSIYTAEMPLRQKPGLPKPDKDGSHAFLIVVRETPGQECKIVSELHFFGSDMGRLKYSVKSPPPHRVLSELQLWGHIGGDKEHIGEIWKKMTKVADEISAMRLTFSFASDPCAINCRAGVVSVLKYVGLDFTQVNKTQRGNSGTAARIAIAPERHT